MAKKQTRRTIYIDGGAGERLGAYCAANGIASSALVEYLVANQDVPRLDLAGFLAWNEARRDRLGRQCAAAGRSVKQHRRSPDDNCRARRAARMVLDDGVTQSAAARAVGIASPTVCKYVAKLREERAACA